jgi:hypothetical protein
MRAKSARITTFATEAIALANDLVRVKGDRGRSESDTAKPTVTGIIDRPDEDSLL